MNRCTFAESLFLVPTRDRRTGPAILLLAGLLFPVAALGHGVEYRVERGEAVVVHFSSHHTGAVAGADFRVFAPDGMRVFARGTTDALGRAVFVPNEAGSWRLVMATADGHGAEVEIQVDGSDAFPASASSDSSAAAGRLPATLAGTGYLLGLGGLLALWRRRARR